MKRLLMAIACAAVLVSVGSARAEDSENGIATLGGSLAATDVPRCVKLCVALLQAIGDEVKEQIFFDCDQISGNCAGNGHLTLTEERVPVTIRSTLDGEALNMNIDGPGGRFVPEDDDHLSMEIGEMAWQVGQFVIQQTGPRSDPRPLVVTIFVEKLIDSAEDDD
jgi:hypothetical protein